MGNNGAHPTIFSQNLSSSSRQGIKNCEIKVNKNNGDKSDTGNSNTNTNIYSWKNLVTATSVKIATVLSA